MLFHFYSVRSFSTNPDVYHRSGNFYWFVIVVLLSIVSFVLKQRTAKKF